MASRLDDSRLLCVSPDARRARIGFTLASDLISSAPFSPPTHAYAPDATIARGVLQLTLDDFFQLGTAILSRPIDPLALRSFAASFYLNVQYSGMLDHSGEGLSFCAGALAIPSFENGLSDAVCVTFSQAAQWTVRVEQRGATLASTAALLTPMPNWWLHVVVILADDRLAVYVDGISVIESTRVPGWNPVHGCQVGLRAHTSSDRYARQWVDDVTILAGSSVASMSVPVEVALNAQQFSSNEISYRYINEPHVQSVLPVAGPLSGHTRVAVRVKVRSTFSGAASVRCSFAGIHVNGTWDEIHEVIRCSAPQAHAEGQVMLTASIEVGGHVLNSGDGVVFTYYPDVQLLAVHPDSGPTAGHTDVLVWASSLASGPGPFACRFGGSAAVPGTLELRSRLLRCATPATQAQTLAVEVTINGQQYHGSEGHGFLFYDPPRVLSISPSSGPVLGHTAVTLVGTGFRVSANICRWGYLSTRVTHANATHVICASPASDVGLSSVELTLNGQQYTSDAVMYSSYIHPHVHELSVQGSEGELDSALETKITLPLAGYVLVRVWGTGFMGGTDYRCQINADAPIGGTYDAAHDCILCWSDLWTEAPNTVEVTLNGREYTTDGVNITIKQLW